MRRDGLVFEPCRGQISAGRSGGLGEGPIFFQAVPPAIRLGWCGDLAKAVSGNLPLVRACRGKLMPDDQKTVGETSDPLGKAQPRGRSERRNGIPHRQAEPSQSNSPTIGAFTPSVNLLQDVRYAGRLRCHPAWLSARRLQDWEGITLW